MAVAMLILLVTAFLPILGIKFEWVGIHRVTGLVLTVIVLFHIIRACFWQTFWSMMIGERATWKSPLRQAGQVNSLAHKLYHLTISVLILAAIATGLLMWRKVDTPFWQRDPYWLSTESLGCGLCHPWGCGHGPGHHGDHPCLFRPAPRRMVPDALHVARLDLCARNIRTITTPGAGRPGDQP